MGISGIWSSKGQQIFKIDKLFKSYSCLQWLLPIVLVFLKFFCQIISVDTKSLVTSFNILELHSKLLGFNILGMSHGPTVLQFLMNLLFLEVLFLQFGYFSFWVLSSSQNTSLSNTASCRSILTSARDPGDTPAKVKTPTCADRCSISLLPSNPSMHLHA